VPSGACCVAFMLWTRTVITAPARFA
jgi:hypothetical protein